MAKMKVIDKSIVDGKQRYTVFCDQQVMQWLSGLDWESYRYVTTIATGSSLVDIPESTYIMMKLVWSD